MSNFIENSLNPAQAKAALTTKGPVLILAGAGSGKTRVLTYRMAHIITQGDAAPHEILAVTFTNKAAREMKDRMMSLLHQFEIPVYEDLWVSTFHSICVKILKSHIEYLGYDSGFTIYDDGDQLSTIKKLLRILNIDNKIYPAKTFKSKINQAKILGLSPKDVAENYSSLMDEQSLLVYKTYEAEMRKSNSLDFNDLLLKTYHLFKEHPQVLEHYQNKFKYIMVDEYQDTNKVQYLLVKMLSASHENLCVVGDEDQSIYSWRGADISNILNFEKDFNDAQTFKLEQNYRSTKNIVSAASAIIQNNTQRKDKVLFSENGDGSLITVKEETNEYEEAKYVIKEISDLHDNRGYNYSDVSIFYRTNAQSRVLEEQLRTNHIPYKLIGGMRFYDRLEIKDIISYLKLILNPKDDNAIKRVINVPARGIGKTSVTKLEDIAQQQNITMLEACVWAAENKAVHTGTAKKFLAFNNLVQNISVESTQLSLSELYRSILDKTQYVTKLKIENTNESQARIDNLEELNNALVQFENERGEDATLQNYLEEMSLISDLDKADSNANAVTLMTLHISKGLEFPNVFIVGLEEGLFPGFQSMEASEPEKMEEERRLAYVGMTRAKENLYLTYAKQRKIWGQEKHFMPSQFIREIPEKYTNFKGSYRRPSFVDRYKSRPKESQSIQFDTVPSYDEERVYDPDNENGFSKGMQVKHPTFGIGAIYKVEGSGETQKVSVMFNDRNTRKFVVKYARLEIL